MSKFKHYNLITKQLEKERSFFTKSIYYTHDDWVEIEKNLFFYSCAYKSLTLGHREYVARILKGEDEMIKIEIKRDIEESIYKAEFSCKIEKFGENLKIRFFYDDDEELRDFRKSLMRQIHQVVAKFLGLRKEKGFFRINENENETYYNRYGEPLLQEGSFFLDREYENFELYMAQEGDRIEKLELGEEKEFFNYAQSELIKKVFINKEPIFINYFDAEEKELLNHLEPFIWGLFSFPKSALKLNPEITFLKGDVKTKLLYLAAEIKALDESALNELKEIIFFFKGIGRNQIPFWLANGLKYLPVFLTKRKELKELKKIMHDEKTDNEKDRMIYIEAFLK